MVTRLEEIPAASIEHVGGREVVQYRGHIMPLIRLSTLLGAYGDPAGDGAASSSWSTPGASAAWASSSSAFSTSRRERSGTRSDIDDHALVGSVVVGDKVVELLDMESAVLAADPHFYSAARSDGRLRGGPA